MKNIVYLLVGAFFGIILIQSEVSSWFRIQEMFRFQSIHMYGVICSAIITATLGKLILRKTGTKTATGKEIVPAQKTYHHGLIIGGLIFGIGWGLTGVCPGPGYALIGKGIYVMILLFICALIGTWVYSRFRDKLPR